MTVGQYKDFTTKERVTTSVDGNAFLSRRVFPRRNYIFPLLSINVGVGDKIHHLERVARTISTIIRFHSVADPVTLVGTKLHVCGPSEFLRNSSIFCTAQTRQ